MKHFVPIVLIVVISLISACKQQPQKNTLTPEDIKTIKEKSIEINRKYAHDIQDTIRAFVEKNNWNMQTTGSGLWYSISPSGNSDSIQRGDFIEYSYTVSLLNGRVCYSSDSTGTKTVQVGQAGVESGLEEAFLLMHKGDSARLIIPPHLAHGFTGDGNNIPRMATLHYVIHILRYKKGE
ncbi:MAG: FKBP-type peptidyl-prolyl cis-trans isomerase [Bacteroidales bacterium]|jgi:FKBP-type peptidyl-prolyl cis-trans isomerase FkpA|nr:FKBP-type peptidyl-prolyl cis-trans isomerase [Bacteroidales bacterium]